MKSREDEAWRRELVERQTTMTEPAFPARTGEHQRIECPPSTLPAAGLDGVNSTAIGDARSASLALAVFGRSAGWGLAVVGILSAALHLVEMLGVGLHEPAGWAKAGLRAASQVLAFVLAGWGVAAFSRLAAASILEYLEHVARVSNQLTAQASQGLALLERIAEVIDRPAAPAVASLSSGLDRARSMAEIVRATRAADWVEAETQLSEFENAFPEDPDLSSLKEDLARARDALIRESLAQLDAARGANDPDRVLEIHHDLVPSLGDPQRASLDQDLARWFLSLIHRRLRTGKVQSDVVQLAARFAERFAATVEGASVRASLPTLRRSVGLCPRCAQPYTGVADACPKCKKSAAQALATDPSHDEMNVPE